MQGKTVIIELSSGLTKFRSISVKSYHELNETPQNDDEVPRDDLDEIDIVSNNSETELSQRLSTFSGSIKRDRERLRKYSIQINVSDSNDHSNDRFRAFRQKEISRLMKKKVFRLVDLREISANARVFNFRFVDEIKNVETEKVFEKSRLVIQVYNDLNKDLILTQSSTIQRVSQRLIVCLTTILRGQGNGIELYLRDVTQAYVQSTFDLNRDFYIRSFLELITLLDASNDCILKMIKSLYDVLEASNH
jgi:hypothetical protein